MASGLNSAPSKQKKLKASSVPNATALTEQMQSYFSEIKDPRVQRTRAHLLTDILIIGILSVIAGGKGWEDMETYGLSKHDWLQQFLALPNGIPCPDTFRRVFERIDKECRRGKLPPPNLRPKIFERCFQRWVQSIVKTVGAQVIPIDGKTLKGSYDRENQQSPLHMVSAWASEHRLVLGQVKVADKSNEITAIPALLELLDLAGCIITIDAMGTQTAIASQIYKAKADYVLALKANHPTLHKQVENWFKLSQAQGFKDILVSFSEQVEKGHHRIEKRQVWSVPVSQLPPLHHQEDWAGLQSVVMVVRVRQLWNKTTHEVQFYLTSLESDAHKLEQAIRLHWGVENGLHWTMDVTFKEDDCRVRTGHAPQNLALLRRIALNALNP